ncbi:MAG: NAD(P)-dependent oxidoreductase [Patescibacteria group bacterium]
MKIVIFGGQGFIGKALQEKAKGTHDVVIFDLTKEDVRNTETFTRGLGIEKPDVVINLAAILGTMKEAPGIQDLFETNVMGNLKVLKAAHEAGVKNYIFTSSMTVHGENKIGEHQTQFSNFSPKHGYSASKASAEFSMMQFIKEAPEMKIVTVRPTMVLGKNTYLPHAPIEFIKTALAHKDIEIYGEGRHEREWIWIDDVAEGILKAVEYGTVAEPGYYPFFLSSNRISMRDLATKVASRLESKVVFTPSTTQAFTLTSNFSESQKLLKWFPKNNIDDIIEKLVNIFNS